jgi:adenylate kinase family enzyme
VSQQLVANPRIHIIGEPGSGKSFLPAALSRRLGVPAYDMDNLFWDLPEEELAQFTGES